MPVCTQVGTPVQSYTRLNPFATPFSPFKLAASRCALCSANDTCSACGASRGGAGFAGSDLGISAVRRFRPNDLAISNRPASISATTIDEKFSAIANAPASNNPTAPAPKTSAEDFSPTDSASCTSSLVGGCERRIACRHTANGSASAPPAYDTPSGNL